MIELLIGPIASGKSTYCNKKAKEGWIVVNDDSIVLALHGGNYGLYDGSLKPLYKQIETNMILGAISNNRNVIIDRTNMSLKVRRRFITLAQSIDQDIIGIIFKNEGPQIHGTRRYNADNKGNSLEKWISIAEYH